MGHTTKSRRRGKARETAATREPVEVTDAPEATVRDDGEQDGRETAAMELLAKEVRG